MEEIFESLIGMAIIIFAIARKFKKNEAAKKAKENPKPAPKMPAEAFETPAQKKAEPVVTKEAAMQVMKLAKQAVMEEIFDEEDEEEKPSLEHAAPAPVSVPGSAPAAAVPVPAAPVMEAEGDCDHPEHEPMPRHSAAEKPAPVKTAPVRHVEHVRNEEKVQAKKAPAGRRFDAAAMRRAVVTAEILNRPVALRKQAR